MDLEWRSWDRIPFHLVKEPADDYTISMSKTLEIILEESVAVGVSQESNALGISLEDYIAQAAAKQALRDKIKRAQEEGGTLTADEVFEPLVAKYKEMAQKS